MVLSDCLRTCSRIWHLHHLLILGLPHPIQVILMCLFFLLFLYFVASVWRPCGVRGTRCTGRRSCHHYCVVAYKPHFRTNIYIPYLEINMTYVRCGELIRPVNTLIMFPFILVMAHHLHCCLLLRHASPSPHSSSNGRTPGMSPRCCWTGCGRLSGLLLLSENL